MPPLASRKINASADVNIRQLKKVPKKARRKDCLLKSARRTLGWSPFPFDELLLLVCLSIVSCCLCQELQSNKTSGTLYSIMTSEPLQLIKVSQRFPCLYNCLAPSIFRDTSPTSKKSQHLLAR